MCKMFSKINQLNKNGFGNVWRWSLHRIVTTWTDAEHLISYQTDMDMMPSIRQYRMEMFISSCYSSNSVYDLRLLNYLLELLVHNCRAMHFIECISVGFESQVVCLSVSPHIWLDASTSWAISFIYENHINIMIQ